MRFVLWKVVAIMTFIECFRGAQRERNFTSYLRFSGPFSMGSFLYLRLDFLLTVEFLC